MQRHTDASVKRARRVISTIVATIIVLMLLNAALAFNLQEDACSLGPDNASYGISGWNWLPPGPTCTFDVTNPDGSTQSLTTEGSWYSITTIVLAVCCIVLLKLLKDERRRTMDIAGEATPGPNP